MCWRFNKSLDFIWSHVCREPQNNFRKEVGFIKAELYTIYIKATEKWKPQNECISPTSSYYYNWIKFDLIGKQTNECLMLIFTISHHLLDF